MKFSFFALFLALCTCCFAQKGVLRVEPANVAKDVVVDDLDKAYQDITTITVTNTSNVRTSFGYKVAVVGKPSAWQYGLFSRHNRTAPYVLKKRTSNTNSSISLLPGESKAFYLVLEPSGIVGDGRVEVVFYNVANPSEILAESVVTAEIIRGAGPSAGASNSSGSNFSSRPVPTSVNLFPNPARERFFVEAPPGIKIGRVEISNALGNRLRKYDRPEGKQGYDVDNLPDGLYLISIYDDKGKKLKTLRLLHRQFGA